MKRKKRSFTAVVSREDDWWVGFIIEIAGVNCQARTGRELMADLRSALKEALEIRRGVKLGIGVLRITKSKRWWCEAARSTSPPSRLRLLREGGKHTWHMNPLNQRF